MENIKKLDPITLDQVLDEADSRLGWMIKKAQALSELDQLIQSMLEPPLDLHFQVINIDNDKLVLGADSPVWAGKLRLHTQELLARLSFHRRWQRIRHIEVKVKRL